MTPLQQRIMCRLFIGPAWPWDLSDVAYSQEYNSVRPAVMDLEAKGLLTRTFDADKGYDRIRISDAGRAIFEKAFA